MCLSLSGASSGLVDWLVTRCAVVYCTVFFWLDTGSVCIGFLSIGLGSVGARFKKKEIGPIDGAWGIGAWQVHVYRPVVLFFASCEMDTFGIAINRWCVLWRILVLCWHRACR